MQGNRTFYFLLPLKNFRANKKKTIKNGHQSSIWDFIDAKFVMVHPCMRLYILFYIHGPAILSYGYVNITKLL